MDDERVEEPQHLDNLYLLLADFFFGCNIPFRIVESDYFKNFIHALNPDFKIPTRKTLSTTILERRYNIYKQTITKEEPSDAVLLIDGWKNSAANTKNVVAMLRLENNRHVFLDSWNFSSISETAQNLNDIVTRSIEMAREQYNINIYAVVTDNASNMMAMGRMTNIWHMTCNSHSGNLLCKGLVDKPFADQINRLLKEFKSPYLENLLLEAGGNRMVLAGDTRWCSYRDAFRRCLRNIPLMRLVVNNGAILKEENRALLFDENLEANLQDHLVILDPICELIRNCEKITSNIADATEYWFQINLPNVNEEHENLVDNRVRKVIHSYGLAANLLHPLYRGLRFRNNNFYLALATDFLNNELSEVGLIELQHYTEGTGFFQVLFNRNYRSWETFWNAAKYFYPELSLLAKRLLNICASTGELERLFSQWAYVHDPKRNRLKNHRSAKLVALYYALRFQEVNVNFEEDDL